MLEKNYVLKKTRFLKQEQNKRFKINKNWLNIQLKELHLSRLYLRGKIK